MGTSEQKRRSGIQVSAATAAQISRHGGARAGAGRPRGSRNKPVYDFETCHAALGKALEGKPAFLFIVAMQALEASLDDVRSALGLSQEAFLEEFGGFLAALGDQQRRGTDAFWAVREEPLA